MQGAWDMLVGSAGEAAGSWTVVRASRCAALGLATFRARLLGVSGGSSNRPGGGGCAGSATAHPVLVALFCGATSAFSGGRCGSSAAGQAFPGATGAPIGGGRCRGASARSCPGSGSAATWPSARPAAVTALDVR